MHNDYVRPSGQWLAHTVPTARDLQRLDDLGSRSVNGDEGGTWNPTSPIIIGGQPIQVTTAASSYEGGARTENGGRIVHADNDVPIFSTTRTRSVLVPLYRLHDSTKAYVDYATGPLGLISQYFNIYATVQLDGRYFHKAATLSTVTLRFRVGQSHTSLPTNLPGFNLARINSTRTAFDFLHSSTYSLVRLPTPASADAYYNAGAPQSVVMTCNQNNTNVDPTTYVYVIILGDEGAGGGTIDPSLNIFHSLKLDFTNVADMRFE